MRLRGRLPPASLVVSREIRRVLRWVAKMSAYGGHPGRKTIAAYLARSAGAADRLWLDEHLQHCISCYRIMAEERFPEPCRAPFTVSPALRPARSPALRTARADEPDGLPLRIMGRLMRRLRLRHRVPQRFPEPPPPLAAPPLTRSQPAATSPVTAAAA
jgi:hypothetical protein